ncbi:MAG TPA: hypothetical protein VHX14_13320 [Thermoanaerobaculia bacterium]|jgi:hypothetical protein|nr:hypothetical protein [Thermoanaerobaculia bacterium]
MTADVLGQEVIDRIGMPKDAWEIAAQLEVMGLRDEDARNRYAALDLFELARVIDRRFRSGVYPFVVEGEDPVPHRNRVLRFLRRYLAGIVFAMPMALQAATMLLWGYGIWGAVDLELTQGSAIALGFIASYIVAGGFSQSIVRRGLFYIYQKEEVLARWAAMRGWWIAVRTMLVLLVPALLANALFRILPWSMVVVAAAFYAGLGVLWLNWALIYLVRKSHWFVIVTAMALGAVLFAGKVLHLAPIFANTVGVITADVLSFAAASWQLRRIARGRAEPVNPPRLVVLVYSTSRYFVYGLLFNAFLFADRVIAWTTPVGRQDFPPYPFWLSVRYELAMDLALVVAIVMSGVVAVTIERFSEELIPMEKRTRSEAVRDFINEHRDIGRRDGYWLVVAAVIAVAAAVAVFAALQRVANPVLHEALMARPTMAVFAAATIGYVFFMFAVRNLLLLLTISRVQDAVRSVAIALVVNVIAGFVCSRAFHYAAAVAGMVAGSIVMMLVAGRAVRRTLDDLDYHYFAAF